MTSPINLSTQLAFSLLENKGVCAVLLGSGVSRAADIPTGWEITLDLIRRIGIAQGIQEQPDWVDCANCRPLLDSRSRRRRFEALMPFGGIPKAKVGPADVRAGLLNGSRARPLIDW